MQLIEIEKKRKKTFLSLKNMRFGLNLLCQSLQLKTSISMKEEKFDVFHLNTVLKMCDEKVHKYINVGKQEVYAYDKETQSCDFKSSFSLKVHNTDSFVLGVSTNHVIKDFLNLKDLFDFINLIKDHELLSNKNKKMVAEFKIETPKNIWTHEIYL